MPDINTSFYPASSGSPNLLGMVGQVANIQHTQAAIDQAKALTAHTYADIPHIQATIDQAHAATQNMLNQNQLFQQEFKARQALGPVMQQSIDQKTGEFDVGKFLAVGAAHPELAWKMPELVNQMITRKLTTAQIATAELANAKTSYDNAGSLSAALVATAKDKASRMISLNGQPVQPQVSYDDLYKTFDKGVAAGFVQPKTAAALLAQLSTKSPTELFTIAQQHADTAAGATKTLESIRQAITPHVMGGQTAFTQPNVRLGTNNPVGGAASVLNQQPDIAQLGAGIPSVTATGAGQNTPAGQIPGRVPTLGPLLGGQAPSSASPAGAGGVGDAGGTEGTGGQAPLETAVPTKPSPTPSPAGMSSAGKGGAEIATPQGKAAAQTPGAIAPPGTVQTSLNPVQKEALEKYEPTIKQINEEGDRAIKLNQLIDEMEKARKTFKSGGGMSEYVKIAQALQAFGIPNKYVDDIAGGSLPGAQEFGKLQLQLATAMLRQALLPGAGRLTNMEFGSFRENNPNFDLDPRAVTSLFSFMRNVNSIAFNKQQLFQKAYSNWNTGKPLPSGMSDITQFEPWFNKKLVDKGWISQGTANVLDKPISEPK